MRIDIDIDTRPVPLPLNCHSGFSRSIARFGNVISWKHGGEGRTEYGRVIGRIAQDHGKLDGQDCTGWLVVATLFCGLTSTGERWVDPGWVLTCHDIRHVRANLNRFLADWPRNGAPALRDWVSGEALPPGFLEAEPDSMPQDGNPTEYGD